MLELRDWTIKVAVGDVEDPNHPDGWKWKATSESVPGCKIVHVTFADDVRDWSLEGLRQTVAHELIHAHLAPLVEMLRADLNGVLEQQAYVLFNRGATRWLEYAVEAFAEAMDRHLPLIEWPARKKR